MFKSFAARTIGTMALTIAGIIVVGTVLFYSVIKTDVINETIHYATRLADTIIKSTRYAMLTSDRVTLGKIIDNIGEQEGVEHVQIFNKKGLVMFSSHHEEINRFVDKKAAGCIGCHAGPIAATMMGRMEQARRYVNAQGKNVLAITAPIYNEPDCSSALCHVHPAEQKVLGTLDIGLFEEPLQKGLVVMRGRLMAFSAILLVVACAAVVLVLKPLLSDQTRDSRPL
ncbi:HAMP domain-containing protein [Geomobilimonas luticola]|uniref:HAMP domain-containing protein n=1 Tax=Geomobilimonas luticola TaxID=1114878 RepID=A0ABS5SI41_9BACT|nr:HAMP domain-containing protein [Geomobilimonas luticola]MBT0654361.1 HAMP domain-containing protein [Geomobilimonas luticola]